MWVLYFVKYFIVKSAYLAKTLHYSLRIVFLVQVHRMDVAVLYGVTHSPKAPDFVVATTILGYSWTCHSVPEPEPPFIGGFVVFRRQKALNHSGCTADVKPLST